MKLFRFLIPVGALLALLAFTPACDSSSGGDDNGGGNDVVNGDTSGGGDTSVTPDDTTGGDTAMENDATTPECTTDDDCDTCMVCGDAGTCVAKSCPDGESCDADTGECVAGGCTADTDCADCETCNMDSGVCESECTGDQVCTDGACVEPVVCDPACGAGEDCTDVDGTPTCVSICNTDMCEVFDEGSESCVSSCADGEECLDQGDGTYACDVPPEVTCAEDQTNENGYCPASIVNELAIAEAPSEATGEGGCCCDFTGDDVVDNQIAALVGQLGTMAGMDLATLNETVAESLAGGDFIILFEYVGMAAAAADTDYFNVNFFLGADTDDPADPSNNFSGSGEFYIMPESMQDGEPLITFGGASVMGGTITAGPSQFVIPVELEDPPLNLTLTVDSAIMSANIASAGDGYGLTDGTLCGYITIQQIFNALNSFAETSCGCLNLDGDLIQGGDGTWTCGSSAPECDSADQIQEICGQIANYCDTAVLLLPSFLDVDLDGDAENGGEAISVGATFGATGAVLVGEEPAM